MMRIPSLFFLTFLLFGASLGKVYDSVADLPGLEYDFVIVGGGTAGNVVANRLTERHQFSVLVLEAGVSNEGVLDSIIPFFGFNLLGANIYQWNYTTTPQVGLNGRILDYSRAHILGGCSAHNGMIYTRGSASDFDRYANLTGDSGWSWDRMLPYFFKNEKWTPPADLHNTTGQFDPSVHSTRGVTSVSLTGFSWPIFEHHIIRATKELPDEFPFNLDMNSGRPFGIGWVQSTIGGGKRSTSATSYLAPEYIRRENLHVLLHAQVSKLVKPTKTGGKVSFGGVQFSQGGSQFTAKASKEIILALGIPVVLDLPSVGKNISDHPNFQASWTVNSTQTLESITQNATRFDEAYLQWNQTHTGPFVELGGTTHLGWLRLDADSPVFDNYTDPAAGPDSPHFELGFGVGIFGSSVTGNHVAVGLAVLTPMSRGSVTINSSDPFAPPLIDPALFASDFDMLVAREALKRAQRFFAAPVWQGYLIAPTVDLENMTSNALDAYIRSTALPSYHLVGSAAMSARNAGYGVVDPDLRVKGVAGVRVIDASVLPILPGAHTQAATYAVAERGADLVKESWK
ncbi:pyranose dehydrogenase [Mycena vulgaris]|nr:pyranose dehydrogenase [Mycena vulgaris]KAJ6567778.1 pyranose dehydrogenase [Mycena vulgaris]